MPNSFTDIIAPAAANTIFGLALEGHNDRRQQAQQQALTEIQAKSARDLTKFNFDLQKQLWEFTNYPNQVKQLLKAGLSPALIYGQSGGGGVTANLQDAGVQGATAQGQAGEALHTMEQGLQIGLMQAQIKSLEAKADLDKSKAEETLGWGREYTEQQTAASRQLQELTKMQTANEEQKIIFQKLANKIQNYEALITEHNFETGDLAKKLSLELQQIQAYLIGQQNQNKISEAQARYADDTAKAALINIQFDSLLKQSQAKLNTHTARLQDWQIYAIQHAAAQGWYDLSFTSKLKEVQTLFTKEQIRYIGFDKIMKFVETTAGAVKDVGQGIGGAKGVTIDKTSTHTTTINNN